MGTKINLCAARLPRLVRVPVLFLLIPRFVHNIDHSAPLISAVVPAYNAERYIEQTLKSLVTQTYPNIEIIVVDDGSSDRTVERVRAMSELHPQIRIIEQMNSGAAVARNRGMRTASGAFLATIDADDVWFPNAAEKLVACLMQSESRVGLVYCWWVSIDEYGSLDRRFRCSMIEGNVFGTLLCHNFLGNASSAMIRSTCIERVGGYDMEFHAQGAQGCEDWDFYLRIAEHYKFRVVPEFLVGYRKHSGSMSFDGLSMAKSHQLLLHKASQRHHRIPAGLVQLSRSSFYLYLASSNYDRAKMCRSRRWLHRALRGGPLFTLLRPIFYTLVAKHVWLALTNGFRRAIAHLSGKERIPREKVAIHQPTIRVQDIEKRRWRIYIRIMVQNVLHWIIGRLSVS